MLAEIKAFMADNPAISKRAVSRKFGIGYLKLEELIVEGGLKFQLQKPTWCARKRTGS